MNEWKTYAGRLLWAMHQVGKTNQSELARAIGVKPQSIQYLCSADAGAQGSTHTPALARVLGVCADWLARGEGQPSDARPLGVLAQSTVGDYAVSSDHHAEVRGSFRVNDSGDLDRLDLPVGETDGHVVMPISLAGVHAMRVKGSALSPYVKDGQYLLLQPCDEVQPEEVVVIGLTDGRCLIKELIVKRADAWVVIGLHGGQPEAIDVATVASAWLVACVVPRRWWREAPRALG